jgi:hypothetical protein
MHNSLLQQLPTKLRENYVLASVVTSSFRFSIISIRKTTSKHQQLCSFSWHTVNLVQRYGCLNK